MFAIHLLPPSVCGGDGERLGRITIGRLTELFGCHPSREQSVRSMAAQWRAQLRRLVTGGAAWMLYRAGKRCYIQQRYFITQASREIGSRRTHNADGRRISEGSTTLAEVTRFIAPKHNRANRSVACFRCGSMKGGSC